MSSELTTQAEGKFFSLMDFMANASREASSLKEYWSHLMAEREGFAREREELMVQIDEISETLERTESQHQHHGRELSERKKEVEKLLLELTAALTAVTAEKRKVTERDLEVERVRGEMQDIKLTYTRTHADHDKFKLDFEALEGRLRLIEGERDHARSDADKYRAEVRSLTRDHTDLKTRTVDITARHDGLRKENSSLLDRIRILEREREDFLVEKDRFQEELRKSQHKAEETSRELVSFTERYDRLQRESHKNKETIHLIEAERDDHSITIDRLRHEIKTKAANLEDSENQYADILLKFEKAKREVTTHADRIRDIESETDIARRSLESKTEEHRLVIIERDQHKDDLDDERRKIADRDHTISTLRDSLARAETSLNSVRTEVTTLTDRMTLIVRERDDASSKHQPYITEITELKEKLVLLQGEMRILIEARDRARKDLSNFKNKYDEMTETITEFQSGSGELEYEIESLRTLLREAREQKERAIAARTTADRERDEYMSKYEEKCRELERWEESRAAYYREHASASSGLNRSTSTRIVTKSTSSAQEAYGNQSSEQVDVE